MRLQEPSPSQMICDARRIRILHRCGWPALHCVARAALPRLAGALRRLGREDPLPHLKHRIVARAARKRKRASKEGAGQSTVVRVDLRQCSRRSTGSSSSTTTRFARRLNQWGAVAITPPPLLARGSVLPGARTTGLAARARRAVSAFDGRTRRAVGLASAETLVFHQTLMLAHELLSIRRVHGVT